MTDAWLGNEDAMKRVNTQLDKWVNNSDFRDKNADWKGWSNDLRTVQSTLEGSNELLDDAKAKHERLKSATEDSGDAALEAAGKSDVQAEALAELGFEATDTSDRVADLADEIRDFGSAQFDVEKATIKFHDALDDLQTNLESGKASLDVTTEAGRATRSALIDAASSTNDLAAATLAQGGTQEEANAILEQGRQRLVDTVVQLGWTEEAARDYANQLVATPEMIQTRIVANFDEVIAKGNDFIRTLNNIPGSKDVFINQVVRETGAPRGQVGAAYGENGMLWAGGVQMFEDGGIPTGIYSGGPTLYGFAEKNVGWEAFISGKPSERERNRQIWVESGDRLGAFQEIAKLIGVNGSGSQVTNNINVTAAPGMDEQQLIRRMMREIARAM